MKRRYAITFLIIITVNFFLPRLMKSDPFVFLSDESGEIVVEFTEEQIEKYRAYYGLDKPIVVQYKDYIFNLVKGNLGYSIYYKRPVAEIIWERIFWTIGIVLVSLFVSAILGASLGALCAWKRYTIFDKIVYGLMVALSQIPPFMMAVGILIFFSTKWRIFPTAGGISPFLDIQWTFPVIVDIALHSILPIMSLAMARVPGYCLLMRNSLIKEIEKRYVITARAKGLKERAVLFKHCFPNGINPLITKVFMSLGQIFGGAILVENVFNYPGIGKLMKDAVFFRDYILIQGIFFVIAFLVLIFSKASELFYARHD